MRGSEMSNTISDMSLWKARVKESSNKKLLEAHQTAYQMIVATQIEWLEANQMDSLALTMMRTRKAEHNLMDVNMAMLVVNGADRLRIYEWFNLAFLLADVKITPLEAAHCISFMTVHMKRNHPSRINLSHKMSADLFVERLRMSDVPVSDFGGLGQVLFDTFTKLLQLRGYKLNDDVSALFQADIKRQPAKFLTDGDGSIINNPDVPRHVSKTSPHARPEPEDSGQMSSIQTGPTVGGVSY